jgi:serine protease AprX
MKRFLPVLLLISILPPELNAQLTRYVVNFTDKNGTPFSLSNPGAYLSQRAIDRRTKYSITIDSTDLPVNSSYITQLKNVPNVTLLNISKWLNAVTIQTSDAAAIATINSFAFVKSISGVAARIGNSQPGTIENSKTESNFLPIGANARIGNVASDYYNYGTNSFDEIHLHNGEFLHNIGLRGKGMQIAMLDNGFNNYTSPTLHAFDSANANHQVLGTWDFVAHEQDVSNDGTHGMACFSTIAANIPGQFVGMAPQSNFWLYQTEDNSSEYPIEEFNWSCGAEAADSSGADVVSTSLGYATFDNAALNHTYADMNGNTTICASAADLAAKKGMLVFAAVGNSGSTSWHYLDTPSDGDSVIAVGAVSNTGIVGSFSSFGPSSDGQVKPDVASVGVAAIIQSSSGAIIASNGTSFACPKMAGLGTCLWQGFPEFNNMKIRSALWLAGDSVNNPNPRTGYGIPNMKTAFITLLKDFAATNGSISNCKATVNWTSKDVSAMKYEIERKSFGETNYSKVADVPAQSNIATLASDSYQKTDTLINVQAGTVSYRIRQIVDTAAASFTATYIDTVDLSLSSSCVATGLNPVNVSTGKITIIPNPAQTHFTLRVETLYPVNNLQIHIVDMRGRTVLQFARSKTTGASDFDLPISRLAKGKYIVSVYNSMQLLASKDLLKL